jgi:ubiquinone/menaquinone biosynthesis C-methylase UbiE
MVQDTSISAVYEFWEKNPLFLGASNFKFASKEFFEEHTSTVLQDCFASKLDIRTIPTCKTDSPILDAGCGIGFWTETFLKRGFTKVFICDLTQNAIRTTLERIKFLGGKVDHAVMNVEELGYPDNFFSYVNCQGVIHHTPNPEIALSEIYRVLLPGGSASISVYYKSPLLKLFSLAPIFGVLLKKYGISLQGRGRENILKNRSVTEIVRMYDGEDNPIGNCYSRKQFKEMLKQFEVEQIYFHYFPVSKGRTRIPVKIHFLLDRYLGLMMYANVHKPNQRKD